MVGILYNKKGAAQCNPLEKKMETGGKYNKIMLA